MPAQTPCAADDASFSASMDSDTGGVEQDKAIGSSCYNAVTGQEERHVPCWVESIVFKSAAFRITTKQESNLTCDWLYKDWV